MMQQNSNIPYSAQITNNNHLYDNNQPIGSCEPTQPTFNSAELQQPVNPNGYGEPIQPGAVPPGPQHSKQNSLTPQYTSCYVTKFVPYSVHILSLISIILHILFIVGNHFDNVGCKFRNCGCAAAPSVDKWLNYAYMVRSFSMSRAISVFLMLVVAHAVRWTTAISFAILHMLIGIGSTLGSIIFIAIGIINSGRDVRTIKKGDNSWQVEYLYTGTCQGIIAGLIIIDILEFMINVYIMILWFSILRKYDKHLAHYFSCFRMVPMPVDKKHCAAIIESEAFKNPELATKITDFNEQKDETEKSD